MVNTVKAVRAQDEISVGTNGGVLRGLRLAADTEGLLSSLVGGSTRASLELGRESANMQKQEYAFCDLMMVK